MSSKSLFSRIKKLISEEESPIKAPEPVHKSALTDEMKRTSSADSLETLQLGQMKQEIFDKIHTLVEEYGGRETWGVEVDNILQADARRIFIGATGIEFVQVPEGEFLMGSKEYVWEQPVHKVKIGKPFYLGKYPVTQKQWESVMGSNPSSFKGNDLPLESVSWNDVQEFIKKLNKMEGTDKYCLPSEAEWEYACRAGTTTRYCFGDDESKLKDYTWYRDNSGAKTHPVGKKKPNPWGLYDMHGNVWEWCQDKYHDNYSVAPSDGSAWEDGGSSFRVIRGGSWSINGADYCRSAKRRRNDSGSRDDDLGFRVLRKL